MTAAPDWDLGAEIQSIEIGGQRWSFVDRAGGGRPILLLPGSVGTCEMFYKQLALLPDDLRVIAVTYPGEPNSAKLADGLAGLLQALGLKRATVAGSSFAGYWAQVFALRHPAMVDRLFLANAFVEPSGLMGDPMFDPDWIRSTQADALQRAWWERVQKAPESELQTVQLAMLAGRQDAETLKSRFVGVIGATSCPPLAIAPSQVAIIECDDDPIIPPLARAALRAHYPGAAVFSLPRGGHYPHILNPDAYNAAVLRVLFGAAP